jgi:hypothetical protein
LKNKRGGDIGTFVSELTASIVGLVDKKAASEQLLNVTGKKIQEKKEEIKKLTSDVAELESKYQSLMQVVSGSTTLATAAPTQVDPYAAAAAADPTDFNGTTDEYYTPNPTRADMKNPLDEGNQPQQQQLFDGQKKDPPIDELTDPDPYSTREIAPSDRTEVDAAYHSTPLKTDDYYNDPDQGNPPSDNSMNEIQDNHPYSTQEIAPIHRTEVDAYQNEQEQVPVNPPAQQVTEFNKAPANLGPKFAGIDDPLNNLNNDKNQMGAGYINGTDSVTKGGCWFGQQSRRHRSRRVRRGQTDQSRRRRRGGRF